jgi:hypothetical protein
MRLSAAEKYEIIQTVTRSEIGVKRTLESFGIQGVHSTNGIRTISRTVMTA